MHSRSSQIGINENRLREAHDRLRHVLKVRNRGSTALALVDNTARRNLEWQDIVLASGVGLGTFILLPWFIALPASLWALFYRTAADARKIRRTAPGHETRLPGFENFWAHSAFRFIAALDGYNARVAVIHAVRQDHWQKDNPESLRLIAAADAMADLLNEATPKFYAALQPLVRFQPHKEIKDVLKPPAPEDDDRFRLLDPMKLSEGFSGLEWLEFDANYILASRLPEQLEQDLIRMGTEADSDPWVELERRAQEEEGE